MATSTFLPRSRTAATFLLIVTLSAPAVASDLPQFETSCDPGVTGAFNTAVAQLHSFEYPESARQFGAILQAHPDCPMARWGVAMSLWHPLWAPPTPAEYREARAVLADRHTLTATPREHAYLAAIATYFEHSGAPEAERRAAYRDAMRRVYETWRDDPEAAVFYALGILAAADPRDKSYAEQYKAAGILNWVRESQPRHPGVLHYIIHSYDYAELAHLALSAAMVYAEAAPDSAHAQHMPSHIFTRLGLWERSLASNHDSTASAAAYTERARLPGHYDEGLHSIDYLMYAMLQTARDEDAAQLLAHLRTIRRTHPDNFKVAYTYAAAPARYVLERRDWEGASRLELGFDEFRWQAFPWARAINVFARGLGAARSGKVPQARRELAELEKIQGLLAPDTHAYLREEVRVQIDVLRSWLAFADGDVDGALTLARAAADREGAVDKHPVTPGEVLPARELYADLLLEAGRAADALPVYREVLRNAPGRLNAHLGAARAAAGSGDTVGARAHYSAVARIAANGSADRAGVAEARRNASH